MGLRWLEQYANGSRRNSKLSVNIPRALGIGMGIVLFLYVGVHLAYFYVLPFSDVISANSRLHPASLPVATRAAEVVFGPVAIALLSIGFVLNRLCSLSSRRNEWIYLDRRTSPLCDGTRWSLLSENRTAEPKNKGSSRGRCRAMRDLIVASSKWIV